MLTRLSNMRQSLPAQAVAVMVILSIAAFNLAHYLNLHLHVLPDGHKVVHSHPMKGQERTPDGHHHTEHEYVVISGMGKTLLADKPFFAQIITHIPHYVDRLIFPDEAALESFDAVRPDKRSPPFVTYT